MFATLVLLAQGTGASFFGNVSPPPGVDKFNSATGVANGIGIIIFVSNVIKIATIVAGLWVFLNILLAGYTYISGNGDSGATNKVKDQITYSVVGLVIIVAAYTITALISLFLFKDPTYILNPTITGPQ